MLHCGLNVITGLRFTIPIKAPAIVVPILPNLVALVIIAHPDIGVPVKAFAFIRIGSRGFFRVFVAVVIFPGTVPVINFIKSVLEILFSFRALHDILSSNCCGCDGGDQKAAHSLFIQCVYYLIIIQIKHTLK